MKRQRASLAVLAGMLPAFALAAAEQRVITVQAMDAAGGKPVAGKAVDIRLSLRDPATGFPLTGIQPSLWLVPITGTEQEDAGCEVWVRRLLNAPVAPMGAIDLNGFDVVQATDDGRLALVDPQLDLASANIKSVVTLGETPEAWAIDPDGQQLSVALGKAHAVAVLTLDPFAVAAQYPLAAAPTAIAVVGTHFWVGTADGEVLRMARGSAPVKIGRLGQGPIRIGAAGAGGLFAIAADGAGAFINRADATELAERFVARTAVRGAAFAALADTLYVLDSSGRQLLAIPRDNPEAIHSLSLSRSAAALAASPDGRWLALTAETGLSVMIYDTTSNRERWTVEVSDPVIDAVFSDAFLYLSHERQGGVSRVVFDPDGNPPGITTVAAGSTGDGPQLKSRLPLAARIPKIGMFFASTRDRVAYMVGENGMAPMSALPLRAGTPAGILLRYRGVVAGAGEGEYVARAVPRHGGAYFAVVRIDQPDIAHCARVEIAGPPDPSAVASQRAPAESSATHLRVEPVAWGHTYLRFTLTGTTPKTIDIRRAVLMANEGNWRRILANWQPVGTYFSVPVNLDHAGPLRLFVEYIDHDGVSRTLGATVPVQAPERPAPEEQNL